MSVLDTNVISELMRPEPDAAVFGWVAAQPRSSLYTTTISQAEIFAGIAVLPPGRRRELLDAAAHAIFNEEFAGRILPFDEGAARRYGDLFAQCKQAGRPIATVDLMIAAVARARDASLVTRNTRDFDACAISLIDPWAEP